MKKMNRRDFVTLVAGAGAGLCAGCKSLEKNASAHSEQLINVGPAAAYAADGVYGNFSSEGVFVVRKDEKLFALSSICTHRQCRLMAEPDHSFYCPCHGSTFDPNGKVTEGPATLDLPKLPTVTDTKGDLLVKVGV